MLIDGGDLAIFLTAALTLNLTPGNDMMFVLGQSLKGGRPSGIAASVGIATGSFIHLSLVAAGVAVLLQGHPGVFQAIRYAGAVYLLWLAWTALTTGPAQLASRGVQRRPLKAWRDGMLVNLLNPKVIVFMFAFLPPFVRPEHGWPLVQLFILGTIFNIGGTLINFLVALSSQAIARRLGKSRNGAVWFNRASAGLFTLLAYRTLR
jgi:threonine/homoserine/homoserine lactone efflux protein